jgi:hypothetical protein
MELRLRGLKMMPGLENMALHATVVADGKPVATVHDDGNGGELRVLNAAKPGPDLYGMVSTYINSQPPQPVPNDAEDWRKRLGPIAFGWDLLLERLLIAHNEHRKARGKKWMAFREQGDSQYEVLSFPKPLHFINFEDFKRKLAVQHPDFTPITETGGIEIAELAVRS